jgi:hypothetical protein
MFFNKTAAPIIPDPDTIPEIDSLIIQSELDNKKLRSLGKAFFPSDKEKIKKAPRTMRELNKLDNLDPDKKGYLNASTK